MIPADPHTPPFHPSTLSAGRRLRFGIVGVVLIYATFAALWILLSDSAVAWLFRDRDEFALVSTLKGWAFVLVTSLLLFWLLQSFIGDDAAPEVVVPERGKQWLPVALLAIAIVVITGVGIAHTVIHQRETEVARLQAIADLKARHISDWLKEREGSDAEFIHSSPLLAEQYRRWRQGGSDEAGNVFKSRLEQFCRSHGFSGATLLDPAGQRLWGSERAPRELTPALRAAALAAIRDDRVQRLGPYVGVAGNVRLDFVAPLSPAAPRSAIVLHVAPADWLYPTLQSWPVPSDSAEVALIRRDGDEVLYLNDLRHRQGAAASLRHAIGGPELLAAQALRGDVATGKAITGRDYRGVPSIGVVHAIPGTDWYLLAKVDRAEVYGPVIRSASWIGLAGLLALFMAGASLVMLRQRQQLVVADSVREAQDERLRALNLLAAVAEASDDAIFAKDLAGRYRLFNRAASQFVGKPAAEVLGHDDHAIFPPEQAAMLIEAGRRVVAEERAVAQEEVLDTVVGKRTFLTTKGPLRDPEGQVVGMFGIARDITDLKRSEIALRDSEGRFRALVEQSLAGIYILQGDRIRYANPAFAAIFRYGSPEQMIDRVPFTELVGEADREWVTAGMAKIGAGESATGNFSFVGRCRDGRRAGVEVHGSAFEYEGAPAVIGLVLDISARQQAEDALRRQASELQGRNDELERFNRSTVGRELEMIALKGQVNRLAARLGEAAPYPLSFLDDEKGGAQ